MAKGNKSRKLLIWGLLVVILLGSVLYWYITLQVSQTNKQTVTQTKKTPRPPTPTGLAYKPPTQYPLKQALIDDGYAVIPELQIRLKIDNKLNDLMYSLEIYEDPNALSYQTAYVYFTTQSILSLDKNCTKPFTVLARSLDDPRESTENQQSNMSNNNNIRQIGDFYYYYFSPQGLCVPKKEVFDLISQKGNLLRKALLTMEHAQ